MIIVFLGPSLPWKEAKKLLTADYRPPARQGDVFRAIEDKPLAILLVDGVFESAPSIWHHELIAAHSAGIALFGASSMGALRAAELPTLVTPLGEIARRYVEGSWNDDAAVALLHGDASSGFKPLSVPWVNVWATVVAAQEHRVLTAREVKQVCAVAGTIHYPRRTWRELVAALPWKPERRAVLLEWAKTSSVDLKADDARCALRELAGATSIPAPPARASTFSSFVRRARLGRTDERGGEDGARRLLLAEFARQAGIVPSPERVAHWRAQLNTSAEDLALQWAESLALEELVLAMPERFVSDGPSRVEGAALMAALGARGRKRA